MFYHRSGRNANILVTPNYSQDDKRAQPGEQRHKNHLAPGPRSICNHRRQRPDAGKKPELAQQSGIIRGKQQDAGIKREQDGSAPDYEAALRRCRQSTGGVGHAAALAKGGVGCKGYSGGGEEVSRLGTVGCGGFADGLCRCHCAYTLTNRHSGEGLDLKQTSARDGMLN